MIGTRVLLNVCQVDPEVSADVMRLNGVGSAPLLPQMANRMAMIFFTI